MRPIEQVRAYLAELVGGPDTPWQERRAQSAKFADAFVTPPNVRIEAGSLGGIACEWVRADGAPGSPVFLHFHGGGYVMGSPALSRALTTQLALSGKMCVVSVDYRLAPEAPFPAALDDAVAAYGALLETTPAANILVGGESAGGGLAVAMLAAARDAGLPMPAGAVAISPWTDLTCSAASFDVHAAHDPLLTRRSLREMAEVYLAGFEARSPRASPLFANLRGLPPLLIHVAGEEVLLDDALRLCEHAITQGVRAEISVWPEMIHVWHMFYPLLPEAAAATQQIIDFCERVQRSIEG